MVRTAYRLCQVLSTETEGCAAGADPSSLASQGQLSPPKRARKDSRGGYCLQFGFRSGELQGDTEQIQGALLNRGGLGEQVEGGDGFVDRLDFVFDDRSQVAE